MFNEPFKARILRVIEGSRYLIRNANGDRMIIELARVVCPSHNEPGAYEAREFVRKQVNSTVLVFL